MKELNKKSFIGGALILMFFGFVSKIIGAIYRIPLTSIIGSEGMGLYQMVFPLYTLMLTISSSGLPSSISKLISENISKNNYKQANRIFNVSIFLLVCFSFVCSLFVFVVAKSLAVFQGNVSATICYYGLAPAIIFVGLISGIRGYFQGLQMMVPSAMSGFIEQFVKMICGIYFSSVFIKNGIEYGVLGAMIGVSVSELVALIYLLIHFFIVKRSRKSLLARDSGLLIAKKQTAKNILSLSVFITLGGLIMPMTMLIDSGVIINILKNIGYSKTIATSLFGLQTGTVGSIINMPVVLSLGLSTAILPCVSACFAKKDKQGVESASSKALLLTIVLALPSSVGLIAFAEPCIKLLYGRSLSVWEIEAAVKLLEVAGISVFYLAMVQVCTGILHGLGRFKLPLVALAIGGVVKIVFNLVLIRIPTVGILGAEISSSLCYLCALLIDLSALKKNKVFNFDLKILIVPILCCGIFFSKFLFKFLLVTNINYYLAFFMTIFIVIIIYLSIIFVLYKHQIFKGKFFKKRKKN